MEQATISVIIAMYKAEATLRRCLDSVLAQTLHDLEIILVDDGSPDNSGAICDEYAARDGRIKALHRENGGAAKARNTGLEIASGDWIGFVDSDDYIESDFYEYLLGLAQRTGADVAQCGAVVGGDGGTEVIYVPDRDACLDLEHIAEAGRFFSGTVWSRIYRRLAVEGAAFDPDFTIGEDLLFNLQVLPRANKTAFGCQAKYHYVNSGDSLCGRRPTQGSLTSIRNALARAEIDLASYGSVLSLCREFQFRNDLDMCSKIVRCGMEAGNGPLIRELRGELRELCRARFAGTTPTAKEKAKAWLIAYAWPLYRRTLLAIKEDRICQHQST